MITYAFYKEGKDATKDEDVSVYFRVSNTPLVGVLLQPAQS
jgi:hypothetical protein